MFILICLEKLFPNKKLPKIDGWWMRAIIFNLMQLVIVMVGQYTWEKYISQNSGLFHLNLSPFYGGLLAYFINTWIFYWWHRARHEIYFLWLLCHQFHHSPERIEVITSFYKHPMEIICNSIIITILVYPILGLQVEANMWLSLFSALSEFFYHSNIKTPHWLGYLIQRPESHRIHHQRNKRYCKNYSDLPIWDILGGTFENPRYNSKQTECETGFSDNLENKVIDMLKFKDVIKNKNKFKFEFDKNNIIVLFLLLLGSLNTIGFILNSNTIKGIAFATASSPLPLVFSAYNGVETFSAKYSLNISVANGTNIMLELDNKIYGKLTGPYNRRNVYGAMFSHAPFFTDIKLILLRELLLKRSICDNEFSKVSFLKDFGFHQDKILKMEVLVKSQTKGNENKSWIMSIDCLK